MDIQIKKTKKRMRVSKIARTKWWNLKREKLRSKEKFEDEVH